jgi:hypothetical protein
MARPYHRGSEASVLDVLFLTGGIALFALMLAYARLCDRL